MENVKVSLLDRGEAKKNQQAVEASQEADGQEYGRSQEYPEERIDPGIGLRNDCEQVEPRTGLERMHCGQAHPCVGAIPGQPVRPQQGESGDNQ